MTERNAIPPLNGDVLRRRTHVSGQDFRAIMRYVMRKRMVSLAGLGVGLALGAAVLLATPPMYSASARIMVDSKSGEASALQSEIEIMQSTPVLSKVAGVLGLYRDPHFKSAGVFENMLTRGDEENAAHERVLARLAKIIHVSAINGTSIIDMTAVYSDPDRAAQIANVLLSAYRERKMDEKFEQSRELGTWMGKHLENLKAQLSASKQKLGAFQDQHGLVSLNTNDIIASHAQELVQEIANAQVEIAMLQSQLQDAEKQGVHPKKPGPSAKEKALMAELAECSKRYGEKHPKIIGLKQAIANLRNARGVVSSTNVSRDIEARINASHAKIKSLQKRMDEITKSYDSNGKLRDERAALISDIGTGERIYENFQLKYQEMMAQAELQDTGIKVISMATIPSKPDEARRWGLLAALGLAGFLLAFIGVFIRALLNRGFMGVGQLESLTGYPVFAAIPSASRQDKKSKSVHHTVIEKPAAVMAEALRSLRVSLRLRSGELRGPRVVALTSTLPDEGKTSLAVMLAMIAAKSGERVVIVDCDLRKPSVHKAFSIGNAKGLQDYLGGVSSLDEVIYRKDPSGVHLITTKAVPSYSLTLLTSGRMETLIEGLREQYDLVILDAPSSLAFADSRVLAKMVDLTLYVVAWNATPREGALTSLKAYADMGYEDLALVLNKVDMREYLRDSAAAVIYQYGHEAEAKSA